MEYGLIGEHLTHSYSKLIQEKLLDNYQYDIHPLSKEEVDAFMKAKNFKAINVTIPYKQVVMDYLDEIDPKAQRIGAVNTIVNHDGYLVGHNTDYDGFLYMSQAHGIHYQDKTVLVLGDGGASQAIQAVVSDQQPKQLWVTDITPGHLQLADLKASYHEVDIIINTTPLGMYPKVDAQACDLDDFINCQAVLDCVYNPYETAIVHQAHQKGLIGVTGLEMLVGQAKVALEAFKNIQIDDQKVKEVYEWVLHETLNWIVEKPISTQRPIHYAPISKELAFQSGQVFVFEPGQTIPDYVYRNAKKLGN